MKAGAFAPAFFLCYSACMKQILLIVFFALSACATITSDSTQDITVTTEPAGAMCSLRNKAHTVTLEKTPGTVAIERSYSPLQIDCATADGLEASKALEPRTRGRAYGNILLFGLPAYVDAYTEEGYEYAPSIISLTLK